MKLHYLSAGERLSKTYEEIAPGQFKENSYPHVSKFTSLERSISNLHEFSVTTTACGNEGLCLLKGLLDRPLIEESRAGHTSAAQPTEWICLDVDYTVNDMDQEEFLSQIDPQLADVDFLFQYSASHGIKNDRGWRGHFFILLESPQSPQALKQWLIHLNLTSLPLKDRIGLSASGGALTFPLDVTTCQNDKLLYIAPPECKGFEDPIRNRFELYEMNRRRVSLDLSKISAVKNNVRKNEMLAKLRESQKLPTKKFKTTQVKGIEILANPDQVTVTGKKEERGFVYLNLNGGDSWAYYFPAERPDILYNFKGEPAMYMRDVDLEIYNEYALQPTVNREGFVPIVFNWPANDTYYRGFANPETGDHYGVVPVSSKAKLRDFLIGNNAQPGKNWYVEDWDITFDPSTEGKADFENHTINTYRPTEYASVAPDPKASIPPVINRVLSSVCVDELTKKHFVNWLAFIFKTRQKTNTAWIFQGVQGTGKGVLFSRIIAPLIGRSYCHEMTMDRLNDDFNAFLAENIILFIDEANIGENAQGDKLLDRVKTLITEPTQHIRAMRRNPTLRDSFTNVILASNYDEIIKLEESDRRFNVAPRQETPILLEYADIDAIAEELGQFAAYLQAQQVSEREVRTVMRSDARQQLINLSKTTLDQFFQAVRNGDLSYFTQYLAPSNSMNNFDTLAYPQFQAAVNRWASSLGTECKVTRTELQDCYNYLQGSRTSPTKFSRMCSKYGLSVKPVRDGENVVRGMEITWNLDEDELELHQEYLRSQTPKVFAIGKKE